jgi:hypothetical protein
MRCLSVKSNQQLSLADTIGQGGGGRVCAVAGYPAVVAKLLRNPSAEIYAKLVAMIRSRPAFHFGGEPIVVAWPLDLLRSLRGELLGYLMPRAAGEKLNLAFSQLRQLERSAPLASLRVARRLALGVAEIHKAGCCLGDLGCFNIMTDRQLAGSRVEFIDTDSWLVRSGTRTYPWSGMLRDDYRAPELIHGSRKGQQLAPAQDHFSLAVLIFRLLMRATHPFMGVARRGSAGVSRETRIERGLWAYGGPGRRVYSPVPASPRFDELPSELQSLFRKTFVAGHHAPHQRPDAKTWADALQRAEQDGSWVETLDRRQWSPARRRCAALASRGRQLTIAGSAIAASLFATAALLEPHDTPNAARDVVVQEIMEAEIAVITTQNQTSQPAVRVEHPAPPPPIAANHQPSSIPDSSAVVEHPAPSPPIAANHQLSSIPDASAVAEDPAPAPPVMAYRQPPSIPDYSAAVAQPVAPPVSVSNLDDELSLGDSGQSSLLADVEAEIGLRETRPVSAYPQVQRSWTPTAALPVGTITMVSENWGIASNDSLLALAQGEIRKVIRDGRIVGEVEVCTPNDNRFSVRALGAVRLQTGDRVAYRY